MRYIERKHAKETWCVWDRVFDLPAEIHGRMLVGLSASAARREASRANEAWLRWRPGSEGTPALRLRAGMVDEHRA
jgi:hypothetical protein